MQIITFIITICVNRKERMNCVNDQLSACTDKAIHSFKEKTLKDEMQETTSKHSIIFINFYISYNACIRRDIFSNKLFVFSVFRS